MQEDKEDKRGVWLVRAGREAEHFEAFIRDGEISVGWSGAELGDLSELPHDALRDRLLATYGAGAASGFATQLLDFAESIRIGDLVITPDHSARHVALGEVTRTYEHADAEPVVGDHRHHRRVEWWGAWSRDALPQAMYQSWLNDQRTVIALDDEDPWLSLAERIRAGEGLDLDEPLQAHRRRPSTRPGAMPSRPARVCPACGFTQNAALFDADSDRCRDCAS
jgi:predicted Mrr-cat superfamily restriction endonuclease